MSHYVLTENGARAVRTPVRGSRSFTADVAVGISNIRSESAVGDVFFKAVATAFSELKNCSSLASLSFA